MKALIVGCESDTATTKYARDTGPFTDAIAIETSSYFPRVLVCEHVLAACIFHHEKPATFVREADPDVDRALWRDFIKDPEPGNGTETH